MHHGKSGARRQGSNADGQAGDYRAGSLEWLARLTGCLNSVGECRMKRAISVCGILPSCWVALCTSGEFLLSTGGSLANEVPTESQKVWNPRNEKAA